MKSICIIHCWFGQEHSLMKYWLKSCEYNPTINFLVFSDLKMKDIPGNVKWVNTTFDALKKKIQNIYDFEIKLDASYKLCDYRPAFGEIFTDELNSYDFWGWCDSDLVFGDIRKWVTDEVMEQYDRIYTRGHFTLFRNNNIVNSYYRVLTAEKCKNYKEVFCTSENMIFDEWCCEKLGYGISMLFSKSGVKQYDQRDYADIDFTKHRFFWNKNQVNCFVFDKGQLYAWAKDGKRQEIIYAHFQKRKFKCENSIEENIDSFVIYPIHFIQNGLANKDKKKCKMDIYWELYKFIWGRLKKKIALKLGLKNR